MNSAEASRNIGWFALPLLSLAAHSQTNIVDPSVSSSATINHSAVRLDGTFFVQGVPIPGPGSGIVTTNWTTEVFARTGECLRLDLIRPLGVLGDDLDDLELVVISPSGIVYRNDDRRRNRDLRPLVKIASAEDGWYTVRVAHFVGSGTQSNFTLLYSRYTSSSNANCANPTPPLVSGEAAAMGLSGEEEQKTKREQSSALPSPEAPEGAEEPEIP